MTETAECWTPVALSTDLPAATVMPAITPAGAVALWRSRSGRLSAFADRCPHRGMRLSHGFVRDEALSCIYHGWRYAESGTCLKIPAHPALTPPEAIRVSTFRAEEAGGIVWVAAGAPSSPPPVFAGLDPLRSLTAAADLEAMAAAGATTGETGLATTADGLSLLLAPQGEATLIHVLVAAGSSLEARIAASRRAEALRRAAEAQARRRAA
ncbi:Rieske 2Fe-2S domain-containing protein [Ensifer soli]|uniref:Rieske 2Fe-2S domain-containing protein n=1 Tax=Ciceribacter sp. sgz301302 TaxID=3342379 RepID=UPI0035B9AF01